MVCEENKIILSENSTMTIFEFQNATSNFEFDVKKLFNESINALSDCQQYMPLTFSFKLYNDSNLTTNWT